MVSFLTHICLAVPQWVNENANMSSLQWCHMSIMVPKISDNSSVCSRALGLLLRKYHSVSMSSCIVAIRKLTLINENVITFMCAIWRDNVPMVFCIKPIICQISGMKHLITHIHIGHIVSLWNRHLIILLIFIPYAIVTLSLNLPYNWNWCIYHSLCTYVISMKHTSELIAPADSNIS